jgi:hypothetical protein
MIGHARHATPELRLSVCRGRNPNAGTRSAEKTNLKADKYKFLRQQPGIDFVPIIFTASGGMGEQFQSTGPHTGMIGWRRRMSR